MAIAADAVTDKAVDRLECRMNTEISDIKGQIRAMDDTITRIGEDFKKTLAPPEWEVMRVAAADRLGNVTMRPGSTGWSWPTRMTSSHGSLLKLLLRGLQILTAGSGFHRKDTYLL